MEPRPTARRPLSVEASSGLLAIAALLNLADVWLAYRGREAYETAYHAPSDANGIDSGIAFEGVGIVADLLLCAASSIGSVVLVVLAVQNLRGRRASRDATWVITGLMSCCPSWHFAELATFLADGTATQPLVRQMLRTLPAWYAYVALPMSLGTLACLFAAAALLLLRSARRHFPP